MYEEIKISNNSAKHAEYESRMTGMETACILQAVSFCDMMLVNSRLYRDSQVNPR